MFGLFASPAPAYGSCDHAGRSACLEYRGAYQEAAPAIVCRLDGGVFRAEECGRSNSVGTCEHSYGVAKLYYSTGPGAWTALAAAADCESTFQGVFLP